VIGALATARALPARISPSQQIVIYVVVRKPTCGPDEVSSFSAIPFHWDALGVHHTYISPLGGGFQNPLSIQLCYSPAAFGGTAAS
jgi:hypothetical protein